MRVLYVTAQVPYPLTTGHLRHYHLLRLLSRRHDVVLLSLARDGVLDPAALAALAPYVERLVVVGERRRNARHPVRRALQRRLAVRKLRHAIARQLDAGDVDAVVLTGKESFRAMAAVGDVPLVADVVDAGSLRARGQLAVTSGLGRIVVRARLADRRRLQRRIAAATPHLLFVSERDRAEVVGETGGVVAPNGVDLDYWRRTAPAAAEDRIVFTGAMDYPPNHDASLRLVREVLPRVRARRPTAELVLAGRDPLPALRQTAAGREGVFVTGECPDLRPHLERAAVYCAPLLFASGIQNKLLEALAMEVPIVTTAVAAEGLRVAGEDPPVVIADDDGALAAAITRMLADPGERARLASAGRRFVERHFAWERAVGVLEREIAAAALRGHDQNSNH